MKQYSKKINRRLFIERTGAVAAGLAVAPGVLMNDDISMARDNSQITGPSDFASSGELVSETEATALQSKWWEKEPLRIVELEEGYAPADKMNLLLDLGANVEHVTRFTDTSPGTSFLDAHNLYEGPRVNFSTLKDYLSVAHKKNIRVIIYFNVHAILSSYAHKHPEWQQIKDEGNPIEDVYGVDSSFCINSGWREEVFQTLRKLVQYEIDGVFYDGPIFFSSTCYCDSCKKLFREKYGKPIPLKTEMESMRENHGWHELLEFQSDSIARFLRDSNKIIKDANPGILLYMNGNTLAPSWPTGRDNRKIVKETDILGAEGGFLYGAMEEPIYKPGAMAKLLESQAGGKPTVVFDAAKQGPWTFSTLPPGEISLLYSQTITHQANVWLAICDSPEPHKDEMDVIRKYNKFIKENPDPFFKTQSLSKIALLWPQEAGNYYSGSSVPHTDFTKEMKSANAGNLSDEFYGFYDGLSRLHYPFDVIDEESLIDDLSRYELIILPNATCFKKEAVRKIRDFVNSGGNLISSFETSLYNETGTKLNDFQLNDVFGTESAGNIFGPLNWDYAIIKDVDHFSLKGIRQKYVYAPIFGLQTKSRANLPMFFSRPLPGSYAASPSATEFPFMIENNFGKGRSVYIAGTFGGSLYRFRFPEYYRIIDNIVSGLTTPLISLENAPSSLEVNLRKKKNSIFLYIINFTSEMKRPIQRILPVNNIKINLYVDKEVRGINSLWSYKKIEFTRTVGKVDFVLPEIKDYEVIEIQI